MIPDIGEVSESRISRLFYYTHGLSISFHDENPEIARRVYSFTESRISRSIAEREYISTIIYIVAWYDDECSIDLPFEWEYRCTSTILFSLFYIVDFFSLILCSEIFSENFGFILDDHIYILEFRRNIFYIMFDDGLPADFEKWFWSSIGERSHARSCSCSHDDEMHMKMKSEKSKK